MSNTSNIMEMAKMYATPSTAPKKTGEVKVVNPTKVVRGNVYIQATSVTSTKKVDNKTVKVLKPESDWKFHQVYIAITESAGSNKILIGSSMNTTKLMEIIHNRYFSDDITAKLDEAFREYCETHSKNGKQVIVA